MKIDPHDPCKCPSRSSDTPFCPHCNVGVPCRADAVRVCVMHTYVEAGHPRAPIRGADEEVPMCEECFQFHESKSAKEEG